MTDMDDRLICTEPFDGAFLVQPKEKSPDVAVLLLHGADGARRDDWARSIAADGFCALALKWWDRSNPMFEIPVEQVGDAARYLVNNHGKRVVLSGHSKGAELAFVAAAAFPDLFDGVIGWSPSAFVWAGMDPSNPNARPRSTWSLDGDPLPFLLPPAEATPEFGPGGVRLRPTFEAAIDRGGNELEDATIHVDRIERLVMVAGGDDQFWPAARMADLVSNRFDAAKKAERLTLIHDPQAGHFITPDVVGRENDFEGIDFGGSLEPNRRLSGAGSQAMVALLEELA